MLLQIFLTFSFSDTTEAWCQFMHWAVPLLTSVIHHKYPE